MKTLVLHLVQASSTIDKQAVSCIRFDKCKLTSVFATSFKNISVAEWADDMKDVLGDAGPSHSIQVSSSVVSSTVVEGRSYYTFDYEFDCPDNTCIVGAMANYSTTLLLQTPSKATPAHESLLFLTHMMADLHEPMHVGRRSDMGGHDLNVQFLEFHNEENSWAPWLCWAPRFLWSILGCDTSLHNVWDNSIVYKTLREDHGNSRNDFELSIWDEYIKGNATNYNAWLSCFAADDQQIDPQQQIEDCIEEWARESYNVALRDTYKHVDGTEIANGDYLGEHYYLKSMPVIRRQFAAGAVRLAALLEYVL